MAIDEGGITAQTDRLGEVLGAYFVALEEGRAPNRQELLTQHPDLANELAEYFAEQDRLDRMMAPICHQPSSSSTVLDGLSGSLPTVPRVILRDTELPAEDVRLVQPDSPEMPALADRPARLQLFGEIARGGMGAILKGRDPDLGRELAVKVLLESNQGHPEVVRRFIEEAQIGGQLQHPGIVPVYELGAFADRRPYFAMKLVKGQTLASLLAERTATPSLLPRGEGARRADEGLARPDEGLARAGEQAPSPRPSPGGRGGRTSDLPRFLSIFESICQTVAYAHARGVIHRDLKPSNVMVGAFGEVQVMDWGLAKVLPRGGAADEITPRDVHETTVTTVRSGSGADASHPGSILGTPSYMAPEQARGELDRVDERSDVFGLGAILCEILTGQPPFVGKTREEIREKAARADVADAFHRLDTCDADSDLIILARDCLAVYPRQRPRDAGKVAVRMTAYQAGVQDRLRAAELARVDAQARAEEERKRRRVTVALAASMLALAVLGGGGWTYLARQRLERAAQANQALNQVEFLYADARRVGDDLARWTEARNAAKAVERLLTDVRDEPTQRRIAALVQNVTLDAASAENDQKLLANLEDTRSAKSDDLDGTMTDAKYADAFVAAGIDVAGLSPAEAGTKIQTRPNSVRVAIGAALDDWAAVRRGQRSDQAGARRLTEIARLADPDLWRNQLRELLQISTGSERKNKLKSLASSARIEELPAVTLCLIGGALLEAGDAPRAESLLHEAERRYPGDLWLNHMLAQCLEHIGRREEAVRYYMAARSIRPETAHELAHALERKGETDQAIAVFQELTRLRPNNPRHFACLGKSLKDRGRAGEAIVAFDLATAVARRAADLRPGQGLTHFELGFALERRGKPDEAIAEYREAIRLKPDYAAAYNNLGHTLSNLRKYDESIRQFQTAIRLKPDLPEVHDNLGLALVGQGRRDEAISEFRTAVRIKPDFAYPHNNLGLARLNQGKLDEAIAEYRESIRLKPDYAIAHNNLGTALLMQGKGGVAVDRNTTSISLGVDHSDARDNPRDTRGTLDEAISEYRTAIRLNPSYAEAQSNLGTALLVRGKSEEAIVEYRTATRLDPNYADAHNGLGVALLNQGKKVEAEVEFREAIRLNPNHDNAHINLGNALFEQGKLNEAVAEFRTAIRFKTDAAEAHDNLGLALVRQGKRDEAIGEFRTAIRLKPGLANAHNNLGAALNEQGNYDDAIVELRTAIRLRQGRASAHNNLATALYRTGKRKEAIAEFREAIRLEPDSPDAHNNLGLALRAQSEFAEAIVEIRRARDLAKTNPRFAQKVERDLMETERQASLTARLPAVLAGHAKPADAVEMLGFAQLCYEKKLHGASAKLWREGFRAQPKLADDMNVQNRYNAACAAALAGCGQGKDEPALDEAAKAQWRKQAIEWLKAVLGFWTRQVETSPQKARGAASQTLQHWKADPDLAGIRDEAALAKLPPDEQKTCRALWGEVEAILKGAQPK